MKFKSTQIRTKDIVILIMLLIFNSFALIAIQIPLKIFPDEIKEVNFKGKIANVKFSLKEGAFLSFEVLAESQRISPLYKEKYFTKGVHKAKLKLITNPSTNKLILKLYIVRPVFKYISEFGNIGSTASTFLRPAGIAVNRAGQIVVVDSGNDRIQIFNSEGIFLREFGGFGWSDFQDESSTGSNLNIEEEISVRGNLNNPGDIAISRDMFILDRDNNRIVKFDDDRTFLLAFGKEGQDKGEFYRPVGIGLDRFSNIFVADTENDRIQKFNAEGRFIMEFGSFGWGEHNLNAPQDVAIDLNDYIYVVDRGNKRIQKFNDYGNFVSSIGLYKKNGKIYSYFEKPLLIFLYEPYYIFVTDEGKKAVLVFNLDGDFVTEIKGKFKNPYGIALLNDKLYITDESANKVLIYKFANTQAVLVYEVWVGGKNE